MSELQEIIDSQAVQLRSLERRRTELSREKLVTDDALVHEERTYDSAYLAEALDAERLSAALARDLEHLQRLKVLPRRSRELVQRAQELAGEETKIRRELAEARRGAEQDLSSLRELGALFLDCLIRARIAGFDETDVVQLEPPYFLPEVISESTGEIATTSYSTLGSGGKKNLFKCCFAVALHRLAARRQTLLPTLLIFDSPMKNISERVNRPQFEGFHQLLYELAEDELKDTQFIVIDKEYYGPPATSGVEVSARKMTLGDPAFPPLITKYGGK